MEMVIQETKFDTESQSGVNYTRRAQWLRAAILGANDGILSIASLLMGVSAVNPDTKIILISGIAGLIAGAFSMGIGELVAVYSQRDIEAAQIERVKNSPTGGDTEKDEERLPNPFQAAGASAFAFSVGGMIPLLAAAFIESYHLRLGVVVAAVTVALVAFGWMGAILGNVPRVKSTARVMIGGWIAMGVTFGLTKAVGNAGLA